MALDLGILKPAKYRNLELKNRISWLPAVTCLADEVGFVTDALIERHVDRAKGGFGLIDVEACGVTPRKSPHLLRICDDKFIPGLKEMTDAVHEHGCKMTVQLIHYVKQSWKDPQNPYKQAVEDISYEEIEEIKQQFVDSTIRARKAGFDGVELHDAHGYTLSSFTSLLNKRTDKYGRNVEGRCRIVTEIMEAIRKEVGYDYCVGLRLSGEEFVKGGNTLKQTTEMAKIYAQASCDFISVSAGGKTEDGPWYTGYSGDRCMCTANLPYGCHVYLAEGIKKALRSIGADDVPVIASGKIDTLQRGEEIFVNGQADIIGYCRPGIADPDFVVKQVEGREKELIKCVYCNGCLERDQRHEVVNCVIRDKVLEAQAKKNQQ